jgi:formate dehydrogenase iron-sulfur subunit
LSLDDYIAHEGFVGLTRALSMAPAEIVQEVVDSGLRGRGGAAFPTGIKWKTVLGARSDVKYVVCNADEGDSGTFSDRMVMEDDPFMLIEGMVIAGLAVGAEQGYIYTRSEYPHAIAATEAAIEIAACRLAWRRHSRQRPPLPAGSAQGRRRLRLRRGNRAARKPGRQARRGARQAATAGAGGLFGKPTVINNVISWPPCR